MKPAVRGSKALVSLPKSRASAAALTIRRLEAQLTQAEAKIAELRASAETDFLLDILNRRGFARELTRAVAIDQLTSSSATSTCRLAPLQASHCWVPMSMAKPRWFRPTGRCTCARPRDARKCS
jgi:hypothetical protein